MLKKDFLQLVQNIQK